MYIYIYIYIITYDIYNNCMITIVSQLNSAALNSAANLTKQLLNPGSLRAKHIPQ